MGGVKEEMQKCGLLFVWYTDKNVCTLLWDTQKQEDVVLVFERLFWGISALLDWVQWRDRKDRKERRDDMQQKLWVGFKLRPLQLN